jgi:beta-1,4-mannosyltransferase
MWGRSIIVGSWPGAIAGNPYLEVLAKSLEDQGAKFVAIDSPNNGVHSSAEVLLVQWPDQIFWKAKPGRAPYISAMSELSALLRWRRSGKKLIWIVHNDVPHDLNDRQRALWSYYTRVLSFLSHGYMTLSPATQSAVVERLPGLKHKPSCSFRHPAYPSVTRTEEQAAAQRRRLNLPQDAHVIGALGRIRNYKGLPDLIDAFRTISGNNLRLLICGKPNGAETGTQIEVAAAQDPRVQLKFDLLSDEDFALTTAACDVIVAPFREYLHSGTLVYLACAEKRCLTPKTPFAEDLAKCVGPGWIPQYSGRIDSEILRSFIAETAPKTKPDLTALAPSLAAGKILHFIHELLD